MKRILFSVCLSALLLTSCAAPGASQSSSAGSAGAGSEPTSAAGSEAGLLTPEEGAALLEAQLGTVDPDTGYTMSYGYDETVSIDGVDYYRYRVSWLVEGDHFSYLTDYLVSVDGTEVREAPVDPLPSAELEGAAWALLTTMAQRDFAAMSEWVGDGVTFTPYSTVDLASDRAMTAPELAALDTDPAVYRWGSYDGSGEPIDLTGREYWDRFVWNTDYTDGAVVTVDGTAQGGNAIENALEAYACTPEDFGDGSRHIVEYSFPGLDPQFEGADWCALKLVMERQDGAWRLIGVVHSEWTT